MDSVQTIGIATTTEPDLAPDTPVESQRRRAIALAAAILITVGFALVTHAYWTPANAGVDQNGYLVGGRMFAQTLSTGFQPGSPFEFVGGMWVMTDDGWVYPKYPIGMPVLVATCFWIGGDAHGPMLAYYIAPLCAAIGVFATFLIAREIVGSFAAVLATILFATNPVLLAMTNSPWSHAPALAFVAVGMLLILRWWRVGGSWRGILGGFLLGYAVTIRYTEALLVLPLAMVVLDKTNWKLPRTWLKSAAPMIAWMLPLAFLLIFNRLAMGTWTGYDTTHESTGFTLSQLWDKLPRTIDLFNASGAYFVLPLGVLGLLLMLAWNVRLGLFLLLWLVPGVVIYSCYYWGEAAREMGYLRFFLTALPVVIISACWALGRFLERDQGLRRGFAVVGVGIVVAMASMWNVQYALPHIEREFYNGSNLADTTNVLRSHTRNARSSDVVLFADTSNFMSPANHLQFATWFELYSANAFSKEQQPWMRRPPGAAGIQIGRADELAEPQPSPIQPKRREYLLAEYAKYDDAALVLKQNEVMRTALLRGRRVLVLLPTAEAERFVSRYVGDKFGVQTLAQWREQVNQLADGPGRDRRDGPRDGPPRDGPRDARRGGGGPPPDRREPPQPWMNNPATPRTLKLLEITRK